MIYGVGTDIVEVGRMEEAIKKKNFLSRLFTEKEQQYMQHRNLHPQVIAGNFAAKEAVVKALGIGFSAFSILEIEILRNEKGQPYARCLGKAEEFIKNCRISKIHISISHEKHYATAMAVAEQES